jgi:hypothetical protein
MGPRTSQRRAVAVPLAPRVVLRRFTPDDAPDLSFAVDDAGRPVWHDAFGYGLLSDEWEHAAVG